MKKGRFEKRTLVKAPIPGGWPSPHETNSRAPLFAALGDRTRMTLVEALRDGCPLSIAQLTAETCLSRQAVTKHLWVLENAGVVRSLTIGRENQFQMDPTFIEEAIQYLQHLLDRQGDAYGRTGF